MLYNFEQWAIMTKIAKNVKIFAHILNKQYIIFASVQVIVNYKMLCLFEIALWIKLISEH